MNTKPRHTDKAATLQMAAKLERDAELKRAGVYDPFEEHRKKPLLQHLDAYKRFTAAKGNSEKHVQQVARRAEKVIRGCKFVFASDVAPSRVQGFLADLRSKGRSAQTVNFYLQAVRQFMKWMVRDRRVPENPLRVLTPLSVRKDRCHDRRAIDPEEFARLVEAADAGEPVEGVKGSTRGMIYLFSVFTGLRRKELGSLRLRSLDLDAETPTVAISAAYSKNGREDKIPLHTILAESLRKWVAAEGVRTWDFLFPLRTPNGK